MADFCHDFDPEGLGCVGDGCASAGFAGQCFGDFTASVRELLPDVRAKREPCGWRLGICEGHGGEVLLRVREDGTAWFEHEPGWDYTRDRPLQVPDPVQVEVG